METELQKQVREAFKRFEEVQNKFSEYGACDTEPDGVMQSYLMSALGFRSEGLRRLPTTGDDWQLYTCSMACGKAARSLTAALKRLEKDLKKVYFKPGGADLIRQNFWRCD